MDDVLLLGAAALAFAAILGVLFVSVRRRRGLERDLVHALETAGRLRDDVWRLEAAAADRDRAEAANEAKGRFLATMSHEIRTPLAGIVGTADLLAAMPLDAEATSYVGAIRTCGAALRSLIDEILDFSRIEAGHLELAVKDFALAPLVESVVELLSPRAQGQGLAIAGLVDADVPPILRGDPARLRQILLNLAGNAIKFTERGGVGLRVSRARDGHTIRLEVADTGAGIDPARQSAIFEEFEQGDRSSTRAHGGTGLGLAISRALADRMGGTLALESSSAAGSCFVLTLPVADDLPIAAPAQSAPVPHDVLLVAHAPFEAGFLAKRLQDTHATVVHCLNEGDAILALTEKRDADAVFDLAIIDCAIGEDASCHVAAAARAAGVARIIVLLSPFERRALSPSAWRAFDGWLVKPVRSASLQRALQPPPTQAANHTGEATSLPTLDGTRVLLAEDDDVNALIATRMLERAGAIVVRMNDGAAALAWLDDRDTQVDIVLMDIRMPKLDGLATARRIRASPRPTVAALPLLALSANAFDDDRRAALNAGFDVFLTKPVAFDELVTTVATAVDRAGTQRAA